MLRESRVKVDKKMSERLGQKSGESHVKKTKNKKRKKKKRAKFLFLDFSHF